MLTLNIFVTISVSETRAVLWGAAGLSGKLLTGRDKFNRVDEKWTQSKETVLINTPDLLHSSISEDKLKGLSCVPAGHTAWGLDTATQTEALCNSEHLQWLFFWPFTGPDINTQSWWRDLCRSWSDFRLGILQVQELQTKMDLSVERNDGRHVICHPSRAGAPVNFVLYGYVYKNIHIGCKFLF